ncbi:hypothetical protein VTN77DRAFT_7328 [Rasamsonia byssochlamydoides]|uniref:uncharacterized protein n=1 Tax=Rasamsonia byssochlamydoides TaxID=89139 RepID=UPI00374341D9
MNCFSPDSLYAPWERDAIRVDHPQLEDRVNSAETILAANFINSINHDAEPYGYLIHAYCWKLIERVIGPRAEQHLELFLQVLRTRWQEDPFELSEFFPDPDYEDEYQDHHLEWCVPEYDQGTLDDMFHRWEWKDQILCYRHENMMMAKDMPPVWDPLDIPAISNLFHKSVQNRAREATKRKTRKWRPLLLHHPPIEHLRAQSSGVLPLEIKWYILDYLDYKDVRNALCAFGWQIAESYWHGRFPQDIFEMTKIWI